MRLFVGIEFGGKTKSEIAKVCDVLKTMCVKGRWKREDNFHLTLKFLGWVLPEKLPAIKSALAEAAGGTGPFSLKVGKLGVFKGRDTIRVLWLGLDGDINILNELQSRVENSMHGAGFEKEARKYSPHITLAQDVLFDRTFNELSESITLEEIPSIEVKDIVLFKSEQVAGKRVYAPVSRFALVQGSGKK
jgi:2'-5' RNA ligase